MKIHISHKARKDLEDIYIYSSKEWGEKQADKYFDELSKSINKILSKNPNIGIACDHVRAGYRQYRVNEHLIFYKLIPQKIYIIRLLHKSMNFDNHFFNH